MTSGWEDKTVEWVLAKYEERTWNVYFGKLCPYDVHPDYRVPWSEVLTKMREFGYSKKSVVLARLDWASVCKRVSMTRKLKAIVRRVKKQGGTKEKWND